MKKKDLIALKSKQESLYNYFREKYLTYQEALDKGLKSKEVLAIGFHELPELIRVNDFYGNKNVYDKNSVQNAVESIQRRKKLLNITQISKLLGFRYGFTIKILQEWGIKAKEERWSKYFEPKEIELLLKKQVERYQYFTENYYTSKEIKALGVTNYKDCYKEIKGEKIDSIAKINKLKGLKVVYSKKKVDSFLEAHREKVEKEKLGMGARKKEQRQKMNTFSVTSEDMRIGGLFRERIAFELQIDPTIEELIEILNEQNISYYYISKEEIDIYDRNEIEILRYSQSRQYDYYNENYYTSAEVIGLGVSLNSVKLKKVPVPPLIKTQKISRNTVLFEKRAVDEIVKENTIELIKTNIVNKYYFDPYEAYTLILKELVLNFSKVAALTEKYWTAYVRKFLYASSGSETTVKKNIKRFVALTELLISVTKEKEIFAFSARELNLLLFNKKVFLGYREILFTFINRVNESLPQKIINVELLNNPYAEKRGKRKLKTNKEIYTTNEFVELLDYVSNTDLHIKRSLEDVSNYFKGEKVHKKYDSAWLYILLHMNNGWRSSDISSFPRVDLSTIGIKSLKDYSEGALSIEDAKKIITQVGTKLTFIHSKNQQKRYFFCSEELVYPLANAILICELRTREFSPDNISIIDFKNARQELLPSAHDNFFENFNIKNFKFASLKMNRTFITFMTSIVKEKTGRNPLEISKFIRNHSDIDTTNIYIEIPTEHLDILTEQLFDTGYFGYTYELLTTVLLNKSGSTGEREIQSIEMVKDVFGDIYKIENLSGYINLIKHESRALGEYLNEQSADEISNKMNLVHLGQLPSKEAFYQCLYGECIFTERDCSKCPFSIPHFHVLSSLGERVNKRILEYKVAIANGVKGEKVRAANQLFSELLLLKQAKNKFGKEVISEFMNINYDNLLLEIKGLDNPYEYMSITKKD